MTKRFNTLLSISTCAATHWESGTGIFTSGCGIPMLGRAVRVDPIKPTMIAPGIMCLKLRYDKMLSNPFCATTAWSVCHALQCAEH